MFSAKVKLRRKHNRLRHSDHRSAAYRAYLTHLSRKYPLRADEKLFYSLWVLGMNTGQTAEEAGPAPKTPQNDAHAAELLPYRRDIDYRSRIPANFDYGAPSQHLHYMQAKRVMVKDEDGKLNPVVTIDFESCDLHYP